MFNKALIFEVLLAVGFFGCVPSNVAYYDNSSVQETENPINQFEQGLQLTSPSNTSNSSSLKFSGQGPSTFSINKDEGLAILHVKARNCFRLIIGVKGKNMIHPETYEDDDGFVLLGYLSPFDSRPLEGYSEGNYILDMIQYPDYELQAPPHTEMISFIVDTSECYWEAEILPMSSAKTISPGEIVSGMYNDVLKVGKGIVSLSISETALDPKVVHNFRGMWGVMQDRTIIDLMNDPSDGGNSEFRNIPPGTDYLFFHSEGYWELEGS